MGFDHYAHNENIASSEGSSSSEFQPKREMDGKMDSVPPHAEHGVGVSPEKFQDEVVQASPQLTWSKIRHFLREPFAEFWGVFILIMFGDGVVAQVVLSGGEKGDYQSM